MDIVNGHCFVVVRPDVFNFVSEFWFTNNGRLRLHLFYL